ncbi:hypothetical protein ACW6QP_04290 [Salegentibacter sp. HM20]
MAYVFRFHTGRNLKGWEDSNPLNEVAIKAIEDPNGAHSSREITSIPSPFARIDLVKTAFKEVSNIGPDGNTIFHKMVSDALDIGQIFFEADKYADKIEIISWDRKGDLDRLIESSNPQHRMLGESLRLYLEQDQETYNFDALSKIYLINYTRGPEPLNIIGGTSPSTLFFTSANKYELEGFQIGNDVLLDDDYHPLYQRDEEFIKYLFALRNNIPNFSSKMPELDNYFELTYKHLSRELKDQVGQLGDHYKNLPNLNISGGGEIVEVLGINLKKAKGKQDLIKESDFVIKSERSIQEEYLPLVLPNEIYNASLKYVSAPWDPNNKAPHNDSRDLDQRTLPADGNKYPYLTISDFLEPVLIRTEFPVDKNYFLDGGFKPLDDEKKGFLLPLKPLFFKYFSVDTLKNTINGEKVFEMNPLANNYVEAILRIPIQKDAHITFRRTYANPVNQAHKPEYDINANKGAIIENRINLGITPFYKFPDSIHQEYNIALYDADFVFDNNRFELHYFDAENKAVPMEKIHQVQRRFKQEETYNMFGEVVKSNFDYIQLKHNFASGILVPQFFERIGGTSQFDFSIDFGTTNTHIEYAIEKGKPKPLEIEKSEKYHIGSLIAFKNFEEVYLKALRDDLFPEEIHSDDNYQFPQRTAINYHKQTNFNQPVFSLANISIPFKYEKESFDLNSKVRTNLKWNSATGEDQKILISFFEELIKIIRNKILLNGGDLANTQITWSYPASMLKYQLNLMENDWQEIISTYLGEKVKIRKVCESLTPYYYYYKFEGIPAMEKPLVSIDIGGGTSDVAVYREEAPILFSSYKFAGDAIFGDNFNRNININGFVNKYYSKVIQKLDENDQRVLIEAVNKIKDSNSSHDVINAFFSLKDNKSLNDRNIDVDFLQFLRTDKEFKIIFLLFYVSQIYHIAQLLKSKMIPIPGVISFSGTASKLLTIIDAGRNHENLKYLASETFRYVFEKEKLPDIDIKLPDNPKEISSKGGLSISNEHKFNLDEIKETLITNSQLQSQNNSRISYEKIKEFESTAIQSFDEFLKYFFELNKTYSFRDNFGIEKATLDFTLEFLNKKKVNALKTGIKNKLNEISNESDEEINETLFFYPLVGTLGELAYELEKKKVN